MEEICTDLLNTAHKNCEKSDFNFTNVQLNAICGFFKALAEESRLKIVCALMGTRMCVAHLAEQVNMEQSAVSHQLKNLRDIGIVKCEKSGKQVFYSLDDMHIYMLLCTAAEHVKHKGK